MSKPSDDVVDRLANTPLFQSLSKKEVAFVAETGLVRTFQPGEVIVAKGKKGVGFFLVLDGHVKVQAGDKPLASLGPGEFFGEMALFDEQPRTADVVSVGPSRCLVLSRWEFWSGVSRQPEVLMNLMVEVVRRLRANSQVLTE